MAPPPSTLPLVHVMAGKSSRTPSLGDRVTALEAAMEALIELESERISAVQALTTALSRLGATIETISGVNPDAPHA